MKHNGYSATTRTLTAFPEDDLDPSEAYDQEDTGSEGIGIHSVCSMEPDEEIIEDPDTIDPEASEEAAPSPTAAKATATPRPRAPRRRKRRFADGLTSAQREAREREQIEAFLSMQGGPTQCPNRYATGAIQELYWGQLPSAPDSTY